MQQFPRRSSSQPPDANYWELQNRHPPVRWRAEYVGGLGDHYQGNGDTTDRITPSLAVIPENHDDPPHGHLGGPQDFPGRRTSDFDPRYLSPDYNPRGPDRGRRHSEGDLLGSDWRYTKRSPRGDNSRRPRSDIGETELWNSPNDSRLKSRRSSLVSEARSTDDWRSDQSDRTAASNRSAFSVVSAHSHDSGVSGGSAVRRGSETSDPGPKRGPSPSPRRSSDPADSGRKSRRASEVADGVARAVRKSSEGALGNKDAKKHEGSNGFPGRRASEPFIRQDRKPVDLTDTASDKRSVRQPGDGDSASRKDERRSVHSRRGSTAPSALSESVSQRSPTSHQDAASAAFASIEIPLDMLDSPAAKCKKLVGPVVMFVLVVALAASLGAAVYFATVLQDKQIDFLEAQIRLRIEQAHYEKSISNLSPQELQGVETSYCMQMDSFYTKSQFKDTYRGCEVVLIREDAINFTLFFKQDQVAEGDILSVIRTSAAVDNSTGNSSVVQVARLTLDLEDRQVSLVKFRKEESFNKIGVTPSPIQPVQNVDSNTKNTDQIRTVATVASTTTTSQAPSNLKTTETHKELTDGHQCENSTADLVPHEWLCDLYYQCDHGTAMLRACPYDSVFDPELQTCTTRNSSNHCTASNGSRGVELSTINSTPSPTSTPPTTPSTTSPSTPTPSPTTTTTPTPTSVVISTTRPEFPYPTRPDYKVDPCKTNPEEGIFAHPKNCSKYLLCSGTTSQEVDCPPGRTYHPANRTCLMPLPGRLPCPDMEPCHNLQDGFLPHPTDCNLFVRCVDHKYQVLSCPASFAYNPALNTCEVRTSDSICPPGDSSSGR